MRMLPANPARGDDATEYPPAPGVSANRVRLVWWCAMLRELLLLSGRGGGR
jgi:hypothetical protein